MHYNKLMNNTKWEEIRFSMYNYESLTFWRTKIIDCNHTSDWDADWFYHFNIGGYDTIEWLEIKVDNDIVKNKVIRILQKIHVPGDILIDSIKVYGYKKNEFIDYI